MRDFSSATLAALARKGIAVIGFQALPTGRFADDDRGYVIADNGACRVLTHADMLALAKREKCARNIAHCSN
jgi:hypothetical protein